MQPMEIQPSYESASFGGETSEATTRDNTSEQAPVFRSVSGRDKATVLICAFFAVFQTIGPNLSYGVFQTFYTASDQSILSPQEASNKALIAFIGTLAAGLTWGGSIYVNPLMSRFPNPKHLAVPGCLLMSTAFLLASFSTKTYHLLLTQGLLYGIGSSLLYFPLISVAPEYFDRRRGAAMGLILSAAGLGGVAFSLALRALLDRVGARWTLRALSLETLFVSLSTALTASPSRSANTPRPTLVDWTIARKPAFILQALAALLQASGNFVLMTFTPEFSVAVGYTAAFGAALLAVNNGVNAVSRVLTGVLADAWGRQNVLVLSVVGSALSVLVLWMGAAHDDRGTGTSAGGDKQGLWVAFVVLYGTLAGGYMALFPVTISEVFGIQAYASVNGFVYFVRGCGAAFGAPVGGQILGEAVGAGSFRRLVWYDGALLLGCSVCVVGVRGFDAVEKRRWRWKA